MQRIRIASCSIMPKKWDKPANCEKMLDFFERSLAGKPDLIMTPEGCLEGYVINEAISENRGDDLTRIAEPIDGPYMLRFREFCRTHRVNALVGTAERVGDAVFNSAVWIDRDGEVAGKYSKTHFQEGIQEDRPYNRPGEAIRGFDTEFGRVGVMICYDRRVPEVARSLMLDGARVLLVPSYGFYRGVNDAVLMTRAHENDLPLVFCHPQKTVAIRAGGEMHFLREDEDVISHVVIELTETHPENGMRSRRRPEIYGALTDSAG